MYRQKIIWLPKVENKLTKYRSKHFSSEETLDFIYTIIIDTGDLLKNPFLSKTYTEEFGEFKGISRIVIRRFKFYFERDENDIVIIAVLFPGESGNQV